MNDDPLDRMLTSMGIDWPALVVPDDLSSLDDLPPGDPLITDEQRAWAEELLSGLGLPATAANVQAAGHGRELLLSLDPDSDDAPTRHLRNVLGAWPEVA